MLVVRFVYIQVKPKETYSNKNAAHLRNERTGAHVSMFVRI